MMTQCMPSTSARSRAWSTTSAELGSPAVVARAHELVEAQIATGGRSVDAAEVARRLKVNADESAKLTNAVMSPRFLLAMRDFNQRKPSIARFFSVANATLPLWKPADITPVYAA